MHGPFLHLDAVEAILDRLAGAIDDGPPAARATVGRSLFPLPFITAGALIWPWEHAHTVLRAWAAWTRRMPDDVTSAGRLIRFPELPIVPAELRGRAIVVVEVAVPGEPWLAAGQLEALCGLQPEINTLAVLEPAALPALHTAVEVPAPAVGRGMALAGIPAEAVDAFVGAAGPGSGSNLLMASLRHLGPAYGMAAVGVPATGQDIARIGTRLALLERRLARFAAGGATTRATELAPPAVRAPKAG